MGNLSRPPSDRDLKNLSSPGDECQSCRNFWISRGKPPKRLVEVPNKFTETGIPVIVCPWCDGTPILDMNR